MAKAIIGATGFVGSTLRKQTSFTDLFQSNNIAEIAGRQFDYVVCAGAPAQKWLANLDPEADQRNLDYLMAQLKTIRCKYFILMSTVDVFTDPNEVDEDSMIDTHSNHAYGRHRRALEIFVERQFKDHLIVRLPGLVGPGLRKNVIYDLLNDNNLSKIDSRGVFQFYPLVNLWSDLQVAQAASLRLLHLTAAPLSVAELSQHGFNRTFNQELAGKPAKYDMRSRYAAIFGETDPYQYRVKDSLLAIRAYAQSEAKTVKATEMGIGR